MIALEQFLSILGFSDIILNTFLHISGLCILRNKNAWDTILT